MPNNGKKTICPYYVGENKKSITCEDTIRTFWSEESKKLHNAKYCDASWKACPYAVSLNELYKSIEHKTEVEKALAISKHKELETKNENHKMAANIGKMEKRLRKNQQEILRLTKYKDSLIEVSLRDRKLLNAQKRGLQQLQHISAEIEAKIAYLMHSSGTKEFSESDFKSWYKKYEYKMIPKFESGHICGWKLEERCIENE